MEAKTTLAFIRGFHRIPKRQKLAWVLIPVNEVYQYDLGVFLCGTDKVLNIRTGLFEQVNDAARPVIVNRRSKGDWYVYTAEDVEKRLSKYYVSDMYYARIYSKEMVDSYLL